MKYFIALFLLLSTALPAHAADNYDLLFGKNMWLNTSRPVTAEDAKGRAVLLDFWTYGCINCMQVIPELKALEKEFGDKLLVIGVHSAKFVGERDSDRIQAAAKRFGITHPVINDSEFKVWKAMGVKAWPTLVLLGPDGKEVVRYAGEGHRDEIAAEIKKLSLGDVKAASLEMRADTNKYNKYKNNFPARLEYAKDLPVHDGSRHDMIVIASPGNNIIHGSSLGSPHQPGGEVLFIAGSGEEGHQDGPLASATFNHPRGIATTADGIYVADTGNHMLRYIDLKKGIVTTVAGTGERGLYPLVKDRPALETPLASPWDLAMMPDGKTLVIAMAGLHQLWTYDIEKKTVSTLAGTAAEGIKDGPALEATLAQPSGLAVKDDAVYFVDAESSALRVLKGGKIRTLIGTGLFDFGKVDGTYPEAMLQHPQGLSIVDNTIYIADTYNNDIRTYDILTGNLASKGEKRLIEPTDYLIVGKVIVTAHADGVSFSYPPGPF